MLRCIITIALLLFCCVLAGCSNNDATTPRADQSPETTGGSNEPAMAASDNEGNMKVTGKVTARIQDGADGSVYSLKMADGNSIDVLLSIPNLGEEGSKALADVSEGVMVEVSGEMVNLGDSSHLVARSLQVRD